IFRSRHDAELNKLIYRRFPILSNQTGPDGWAAFYMRLVDLGDHAGEVRFPWEEKDGEWDVPLYESKLINSYNHRFSSFGGCDQQAYRMGQPRETTSDERNNPQFSVQPRYFVRNALAAELFGKYPDQVQPWLLIWRDISNATNERTSIATVI